MPVQFLCSHCRQFLSVGQRKVGSMVNCPKCGQATMVPNPEAAAAEIASARLGNPRAEMLEVVVYDDIPDLLLQGTAAPVAVAPQPATNGAAANAARMPASPTAASAGAWTQPVTERASPTAARPNSPAPSRSTDMLLVSRQALYAQAALFCLVALVAFAAGYFIGRGRPHPESKEAKAAAAAQTVSLKGSITFVPGTGGIEGDGDSVVMALPRGNPPARKLSARGLRPRDPDDALSRLAIEAIHDSGGDCVRVEENGAFHLVVPKPGDFYLLLISRKASRPSNQPVSKADAEQMADYFESVADLIGSSQYRWTSEHLEGAPAPLAQRFGAPR